MSTYHNLCSPAEAKVISTQIVAEVLDVALALVSNPYLRQQGQQEVLGPESQELKEYDYQ